MAKTYRTKLLVTLAALTLGVVIQVTPAQAIDQDGRYLIHGVGNQTCYAVIHDELTASMTNTWMTGYLSAYNHWTSDLYGLTTDNGWQDWVRTYCRQNPAHSLADAGGALVRVLWSSRHLAAPATVVPPAPQPRQQPVSVKRPARSPQY